MNRRSFLRSGGVVSVLVAGGGVWRAYDQGVFSAGEGPAYEPWKDWRSGSDGDPLTLVRAAILAASPHNTQPWLFKVSTSAIALYLDTKRNVGALDPYLREEHIGIGCALENLMLAAAANGYGAVATLLPGKLDTSSVESGPRLVARVDLVRGKGQENELYKAIPLRHTNRSPYDPLRPVPPECLETLMRITSDETAVKVFLFAEAAERKRIVEISSAANDELYSDPDVKGASERWIRTRWSSVQTFRDGLTIDTFGLPPAATAAAKLMSAGMLRWAASRAQKDGYSTLMMSAPLIGMIAVHDRYDREQTLRTGRIWQRAHLLVTTRGLAGRPCNEAVEMVDHERMRGNEPRRLSLLAELTGDAAWQPTFIFYVGYPARPGRASPRRALQEVLV
jgi:hypothetical protein